MAGRARRPRGPTPRCMAERAVATRLDAGAVGISWSGAAEALPGNDRASARPCDVHPGECRKLHEFARATSPVENVVAIVLDGKLRRELTMVMRAGHHAGRATNALGFVGTDTENANGVDQRTVLAGRCLSGTSTSRGTCW